MGSLSSIVVNITGDASGLNRALTSAQSKVRAAGKSMQRTGMQMTKFVTLPIAGIGAAALKTAADNQKAMQEIQAASAKTAEEMELIENAMDNIRTTTGHSAQELQDAMALAQSSTLDLKEANELVETSAKASAAGFGEMRSMVNLATSAKKKFGEEVGTASDVLNTLVGTADQVQAEMDQFVPAFLEGTGMMQEFNMKMDEGAALFGKLSSAARDTNAAGTQFKGLLGALAKPQKDLKNLLDKSFGSFKNFRKEMENNSVKALKKFKKATQNSDKTLAQLLGRKRAVAGFNNLFAGGLSEVNDIMKNQSARQDLIQKKFKQTDGFLRKMAVAFETVKVSLRPLGEEIMPIVADVLAGLVGHIKAASKWFKSLSDEQQSFIVKAAGIAAVLGPALFALGTFVTVIGSAIGTLGSLISVIGTTSTVLVSLSSTIITGITSIATSLSSMLVPAISAASGVLTGFLSLLGTFVTTILAPITAITALISSLGLLVGAIMAPKKTAKLLVDVLVKLVKWFNKLGLNIKPAIKAILNFSERTHELVEWMFAAIKKKFKQSVTWIVKTFKGLKNKLVSIAKGIGKSVKKWFVDKFNAVLNKIKRWKNAVVGTFSSMKKILVGNSIVPDTVNAVNREFRRMKATSLAIIAAFSNNASKRFQALRSLAMRAGKGLQRSFIRAFKGVLKGTQTFGQAWASLWDSIVSQIISMLASLIAKLIAVITLAATIGFISGGVSGAMQAAKGAFQMSTSGGLMNFASGGTVPGRPGEPQLAVVHGGEQIKSRGESMTRGEKRVRDRGRNQERLEVDVAGEPAMQALFERMVDDFRLITGTDK